jgi:hypothetical protein
MDTLPLGISRAKLEKLFQHNSQTCWPFGEIGLVFTACPSDVLEGTQLTHHNLLPLLTCASRRELCGVLIWCQVDENGKWEHS